MIKGSWSDDDRTEYENLVAEALRHEPVPERVDVFLNGAPGLGLDGFDKALKAGKSWAEDVLSDWKRDGAERLLSREHTRLRPPVPVTRKGRLLGKARHPAGYKKRDDSGKRTYAQTLFDFLTWEQLREKAVEIQASMSSQSVRLAAIQKLLTLQLMVPDAANPAEACEALGMSIEEFLAS
jgi:hypothetical protein